MYGTTRQFLNYFNLKSLDGLPSLAELRDLSAIGRDLQLDLADIPGLEQEAAAAREPEDGEAGAANVEAAAAGSGSADGDAAILH
jgi:segregation and condensation protein B